MSTLDSIKNVITQIIQETDSQKPDIYCSTNVFSELIKRPDCQLHPTQKDTIVMLPNVYWTKDPVLEDTDMIAYTNRGLLIVQYLELVSQLIMDEHGSLDDVHKIIRELLNKEI